MIQKLEIFLQLYGGIELSEDTYLKVRELMKSMEMSPESTEYEIEIEEVWVDNLYDDSKVRLLIVKPANPTDGKHLLYYSIHGGGMVIGDAEMSVESLSFLAHHYNFIGVSVDYRLAPEYHQPAQLHDCYSGIKWIVDHAEQFNIDLTRIAIQGGSAGAGLAGGLALYIRDQKEFDIHFLQLDIPMLDDRTAAKEKHPYNGELSWTYENNYFGWKSVLNQEPGSEGVSPYYFPARADSLAGLPPTYISVGSIELFADEALDFARKLMYDGVPVELHLYPGYHHMGLVVETAFHAKKDKENRLDALLRALKIDK